MIYSFGFEKIQVKHKYQKNQNISGANLLLVPYDFDEI